MPASVRESTWDFSPVFSLLHSLSHKDAELGQEHESRTLHKQPFVSVDETNLRSGIDESLGNFSKVWDFLGVQRDVPPPSVPTFEAVTAGNLTEKDAYASDGALYYPPSSKSVKWRDEEEGMDLTDVQPESPPAGGELTKSQRKKKNRRARKAAEVATQNDLREQRKLMRDSRGCGNESESSPPAPAPLKLASIGTIPPLTATKESKALPPHVLGKTANITTVANNLNVPSGNPFTRSFRPTLPGNKSNENMELNNSTPTRTKMNGNLQPASVTPKTPSIRSSQLSTSPPLQSLAAPTLASPKTPVRPALNTVHDRLKNQWPIADPFAARTLSASAQAPRTQLPGSNTTQSKAVTQTPTRKRYELVPLVHNNSVDRNWSLLLKLINNFPNDRAHLLSPLQLTINRPVSDGIHVFVDASNIIIGFHDTLKRVRNIPQYARVPHVNLNFHALALLLERRRPVTKRVLAGSTPEMSAFEEARQVGYETNILDKVFKAKELTEKQRRYAIQNATRRSGYQSGSDSAGNGLLAPNSDGTVTDGTGFTLPPQQPKWVEQAVDEILHLKILESIVDTPIPATAAATVNAQPHNVVSTSPPTVGPTMVLATGDAAEAEYSSGFMKMVQRALGKGWNVEVMAWSKSVSMEYRKMERSPALGERFKIIELDDYAEELFGEAV